jgi:hypothetical protein
MSEPDVIVKYMFDTNQSGSIFAVASPRVPGDPADPARCHVQDGPALSVSTVQMLGCTAALSWMTHGRERDQDPAARGRVTVYEPEDCEELVRQYLEHAPRRTGPTLIPIQV